MAQRTLSRVASSLPRTRLKRSARRGARSNRPWLISSVEAWSNAINRSVCPSIRGGWFPRRLGLVRPNGLAVLYWLGTCPLRFVALRCVGASKVRYRYTLYGRAIRASSCGMRYLRVGAARVYRKRVYCLRTRVWWCFCMASLQSTSKRENLCQINLTLMSFLSSLLHTLFYYFATNCCTRLFSRLSFSKQLHALRPRTYGTTLF